jgi:hypothetical protein
MPQHEGARGRRPTPVECHPVPDGLSMITARDLNDPASPRLRHYLPRFQASATPDPGRGEWSEWISLLSARDSPTGQPADAMAIVTGGDYGTVCSSLVAVPAEGPPRMLFAAGVPGEAAFEPVAG